MFLLWSCGWLLFIKHHVGTVLFCAKLCDAEGVCFFPPGRGVSCFFPAPFARDLFSVICIIHTVGGRNYAPAIIGRTAGTSPRGLATARKKVARAFPATDLCGQVSRRIHQRKDWFDGSQGFKVRADSQELTCKQRADLWMCFGCCLAVKSCLVLWAQ